MTVTRGTSNGNVRGSAESRRVRRAWMMKTWASDVVGLIRCYRCGYLLFNEDDPPEHRFEADDEPGTWGTSGPNGALLWVRKLTIDRIIPGCRGGTYRRNNIRPACGKCNSETGGSQRSKTKTRPRKKEKP